MKETLPLLEGFDGENFASKNNFINLTTNTSPMLFAKRSKVALSSLAILALSSSSLLAQSVTEKNALQKYILDGGPTMFLIGFAIIALIGLIVFNFLNLQKNKFAPADLKAVLMDHMQHCRVRSAIEVSASSPTYLGRMLAYSLPNIDATRPEDLGRDKVEDAIADFTINENRKNMVWIGFISLVAQAAPMLGLLGTVIGMVKAFSLLSSTGAPDAAKLAGSISVALLTTMWGLITAVPAVIAYFMFKNKLNRLVAESHNTAEELINASITTINQDAQLSRIPEGFAG